MAWLTAKNVSPSLAWDSGGRHDPAANFAGRTRPKTIQRRPPRDQRPFVAIIEPESTHLLPYLDDALTQGATVERDGLVLQPKVLAQGPISVRQGVVEGGEHFQTGKALHRLELRAGGVLPGTRARFRSVGAFLPELIEYRIAEKPHAAMSRPDRRGRHRKAREVALRVRRLTAARG